MATNRNPIFDIMKGIGIIAVLIGHIPPPIDIYHFIYTFHLPMFFLLAGYMSNINIFSWNWKQHANNAKRLLLPFIITTIGIVILNILEITITHDWHRPICNLLSILWGGADALYTPWGNVFAGPMWFLLAMFWAREMLWGLGYAFRKVANGRDEVILLVGCLLGFGMVQVHRVWDTTPLCFVQGFAAMQFITLGWYFKHHPLQKWSQVIFVLCWLAAIKWGGVEMIDCQYDMFLIDVLGACGATIVIYYLCQGIVLIGQVKWTSWLAKSLTWCGQYSLIILCMHTLDRKTYLVRAIKHICGLNLQPLHSTLFHYIITIALVWGITKIPKLKQLYE